tara:strand:- start:60474 stop:60917 length:444 start_codon:yes stop_codon:yes gene_type:complete
MKLNPKSQWDENQIVAFLATSRIPIRLSFLNKANEPQICSLWYEYEDAALWSASHKNSFLINQLKHNSTVSFEISTNDYPYKGVRGKAEVELSRVNADRVLGKLIAKYLGDGNTALSSWLLGRADDEYVIRIKPTLVNSWDFSGRME